MTVTLRPVTADDEAFLFQLYSSTRQEELDAWGWGSAERKLFLEQQYSAQKQSYLAAFPSADHQIIVDGDQPIGRLMVDRAEHELRLLDIALLPQLRNSGIGTRLITELLAEATAVGKSLRLQVLKVNPAARLYDRLGFVVVGDDGLYMQMEAPPGNE